jgi:CBS domain-containing protein
VSSLGIVTERDLVRKVLGAGRASERLDQIMTRRLITVSPAYACMPLMVENHIRHVPVVERGRLVGVLSMRDLARHVLAEKEFVIR